MNIQLKVRTGQTEQSYTLHPDYSFADLVMAFDRAILENKRVAIVTTENEEVRLDLKRFSAMALTTEALCP